MGIIFLKLKRRKISASDKNPNMLFLRNEISKIFEEFISSNKELQIKAKNQSFSFAKGPLELVGCKMVSQNKSNYGGFTNPFRQRLSEFNIKNCFSFLEHYLINI